MLKATSVVALILLVLFGWDSLSLSRSNTRLLVPSAHEVRDVEMFVCLAEGVGFQGQSHCLKAEEYSARNVDELSFILSLAVRSLLHIRESLSVPFPPTSVYRR